jgi:hypothetical protein
MEFLASFCSRLFLVEQADYGTVPTAVHFHYAI